MVGIYKDRGLSERVNELHLGTVEAGKGGSETYYVSNDTGAELHEFGIHFPKGKPEGLKVFLPKTIKPKSVGTLVISWKPPLALRKALSVGITITYKEVYIAKK